MDNDTCYSSPSYEYEEDDDDLIEESNNDPTKPCMIRWKSGKRVDPRLLTTLESFKEIYDERRDFFKNIFPAASYEVFVDVFKKLGEMMKKNNEAESMEWRTLERSLSLGSPRASSRGIEMEDEFVDEKFKVKPPTVIIGGGSGQGKGK